MYWTSTVIVLQVDAWVNCLSILLVQCNICNFPFLCACVCFVETWTLKKKKHPTKAYMHPCLKCVFLLNVRQLYRTVMCCAQTCTHLACIAGIHAICWQLCTNVFIYPDRVEHCALNILTFIFDMWAGRLQNDCVRGQGFFFFFPFLILLNTRITIRFKLCKNKSTWGA